MLRRRRQGLNSLWQDNDQAAADQQPRAEGGNEAQLGLREGERQRECAGEKGAVAQTKLACAMLRHGVVDVDARHGHDHLFEQASSQLIIPSISPLPMFRKLAAATHRGRDEKY